MTATAGPPRLHRLHRAAAGLAVLWLGACAGLPAPQSQHLLSPDEAIRECAQWFRDLDQRVDDAGVRDAEAMPIAGFPYLRSTRFLAAWRDVPPDGLQAWAERLRDTDLHARAAELRNLPQNAPGAMAKAEHCGLRLLRRDLADPAAVAALRERSAVVDAYRDWQRALGLYAVTRIPFARGVAQWHAEARAMFAQSRSGGPAAHPLLRYGPAGRAPYTQPEVAALLARAAAQPLGLPHWTADEQARLLATHAPVFEVETTGDYDRPGALVWRAAGHPEVDAAQPVVYQRIAYTRYRGRTLVQLVYTIWFGERPPDAGVDLLAGKLDGLVWRVTLAPDGAPAVYDTMHPCGCFHMFFPAPGATPRPAPDPDEEWAFIPATLPAVAPGERIRLRLNTRMHYLVDVGTAPAAGEPQRYVLLPEAQLQSLPLPGGGYRSAYGPDGLVPGTARAERLLFWPMGIPSAGAMRQWGTHATAFLGRRHFDDADLIERRFELRD